MLFCFQLTPHANIRYREAQLKLGKAELSCLLGGLGIFCPVEDTVIGGVTFLTFEAEELTPAQLSALSRHSAALMICERQGELLGCHLAFVEVDGGEVVSHLG